MALANTPVVRKPLLPIDPRTKFFLLFFVGFFTFVFPPWYMEVSVMAGLALLLSLNRQAKTALTMFLVFCVMLAADLYLTPFVSGVIRNVYFTVVRLVRMLLPLAMVGLLLVRTITVTEFIAAFRKMRLPDGFIIPFSVMFRFIPTIHEEWASIRSAMKFRGIGISARNVLTKPMMTLEYTLVPLLMSTATIATELAAASLARGLDSGGKRTCIVEVRFRLQDYLVILLCVFTLVWWRAGAA
ncbi:MAG: energy-coupling factor transporter transmembrane protein EcfT [Spirochaetaceae bacterium]|jgi:energy-coupling factor transport system permease protein|nr:energy-coupling factor transporter transmembrane protein EcfT [Spirochaetaceae bacterium]